MKKISLTDCWVNIMSEARRLITEPDLRADVFAATMTDALNKAADLAHKQGYPKEDIQQSLFAIVAWLDEVAMTSAWPGATAWRLAPLQLRYFSSARAGVEFFERLEALPADAIHVREVYALALIAGFTGKFVMRPAKELVLYRRECLQGILSDSITPPLATASVLFYQPDSPHLQPRNPFYRNRARRILICLILIPVLLLSVLYTELNQSLNSMTSELTGKP